MAQAQVQLTQLFCSSQECRVEASREKKGAFAFVRDLHPADINEEQVRSSAILLERNCLDPTVWSSVLLVQVFSLDDGVPAYKLRLTFHGSSDFYGRVTVYHLRVLGEESVGVVADAAR